MAIITRDSTTAGVDAEGVLAELVEQVSDTSPSYTEDDSKFISKFKGPYKVLKDANLMVGKEITAAFATIQITTTRNFTFPTPPVGMVWLVTSTRVEQLEAGDHAILTVECEAWDGTVAPEGEGSVDPYSDTWNLRWESYTLKPFAFAKNEPGLHLVYTDTAIEGDGAISGYADRSYIEQYLNGNDKGTKNHHYWFRDNQGEGWILNTAEELILRKELEGKSALWHYPVLTHVKTTDYYVSNVSSMLSDNIEYRETIGDKIDYIVGGDTNPSEKPAGCPYTFPSSPRWIWVKIGDDMSHIKAKHRVSFTRTETFMGVISADVNYYGNNEMTGTESASNPESLKTKRWKPGSL
ncbi:hypothetical protein [Fibrobacter sp.]|uniref:hypothetical protein n=1 Tax=Fibrobacter sp. TaxID=35828 RepID=UPI0038908E4D